MTRRRYFPLTPVGRARDSSNILRISSPSDSTDASETAASGPLVLEWLDSETLEWGATLLTRTTGDLRTLGVGFSAPSNPIVESARLRNAPADADIEWTLEKEFIGAPGAALAWLVSGTDSQPEAGLGNIVTVTVPQWVTQMTEEPGATFLTSTAVVLVELSATYNGVTYGPISLVITGAEYYLE